MDKTYSIYHSASTRLCPDTLYRLLNSIHFKVKSTKKENYNEPRRVPQVLRASLWKNLKQVKLATKISLIILLGTSFNDHALKKKLRFL